MQFKNKSSVYKLKVADLRSVLKERNLDTKGTKNVLVDRMWNHVVIEQEEELNAALAASMEEEKKDALVEEDEVEALAEVEVIQEEITSVESISYEKEEDVVEEEKVVEEVATTETAPAIEVTEEVVEEAHVSNDEEVEIEDEETAPATTTTSAAAAATTETSARAVFVDETDEADIVDYGDVESGIPEEVLSIDTNTDNTSNIVVRDVNSKSTSAATKRKADEVVVSEARVSKKVKRDETTTTTTATTASVSGDIDTSNVTSTIVHIENFVRPFSHDKLKKLLLVGVSLKERTTDEGEIMIWMNSIKTHCFVKYSTKKSAKIIFDRTNGVKWPEITGKILKTSYSTVDAMKEAMASSPPARGFEAPTTLKLKPRNGDRNTKAATSIPTQESLDAKKKTPIFTSRNREKLSLKAKKMHHGKATSIDDIFHKTRTAPHLYFQPLSAEEVKNKTEKRNEFDKSR